MKGEWCYWENYFSAEECQFIIDNGVKLPSANAVIGYDSNTENVDYRRSKVRWIDETPQWSWLYLKMWTLMRLVNHEWFNFNVTTLPPLQLAEYDSAQLATYGKHQDVFWINPTNRHRKLSVVVQLTDPNNYEGGDLEFHNVEAYPPRNNIRGKGCAICFPSFVFHQLTPVTAGLRYSLVAWFEGPKWT